VAPGTVISQLVFSRDIAGNSAG